MIEIITIIVLCVSLIGSQYISWKEREKLMKMIMAKDLKDLTDNEYTEKLKPTKQSKQPDVVELNPDEDTIFDRAIKHELTKDESERKTEERLFESS